MIQRKRSLPNLSPVITGCLEEWMGYKPNLQIFAWSGCSLGLNPHFRAGWTEPLPSHQATPLWHKSLQVFIKMVPIKKGKKIIKVTNLLHSIKFIEHCGMRWHKYCDMWKYRYVIAIFWNNNIYIYILEQSLLIVSKYFQKVWA